MTVIVGVDGSAHAKKALEWTLAEARLRDEPLLAVYVYTSLSLYYPADVFPTASARALAAETRQAAADELDQALAEVGDLADGVQVIPKTVQDPQPAYVLTDLATADDLLVVGSRGRGGFKGLLLGSVSQHCVQHAPCPVTVVRAGPPP